MSSNGSARNDLSLIIAAFGEVNAKYRVVPRMRKSMRGEEYLGGYDMYVEALPYGEAHLFFGRDKNLRPYKNQW